MAALIGVDIGGTFTDAAVIHDGALTTAAERGIAARAERDSRGEGTDRRRPDRSVAISTNRSSMCETGARNRDLRRRKTRQGDNMGSA